ncbi:MAG: mannose-6-phosphate isomerase [Sphingomonadales bacterium]|jgi:mannose-6-phosphate isomerase|nr:mannose-6-phosphate isomerase [Sphingomonadales bacterium]
MKLTPREVEKPWGRDDGSGRRIGEIWFEAPDGRALPLLVKYLFTSDKLSVQVHPDDANARARGLPHGKSECWYVVAAEPRAKLALGLREGIGEAELRAAAADGSIEARLDWIEPRAGDFFSVPAGTIHAIGPGLSLIEIQQPSDVTYRLYDYGRDRELHVEDAVAVANLSPSPQSRRRAGPHSGVLLNAPPFSVAYVAAGEADPFAGLERWVIPLTGGTGDCLYLEPGEPDPPPEHGPRLVASVNKI